MLPSELSLALGGHQPEIMLPPSTWGDRVRRQIGRLRMVRRTLQARSAAPAIFRRFWQWAEEKEARLRDADRWSPDRFLAQSLELKATMEEYLVADRRLLRAAHLRQEPPDIIVGEVPIKKAPPPEATGPVLQGTGVAAGQASGTARVIRHPDERARLKPGEILVAPSTDPAWTPLFLRASAVVVEVGGYLSHGAIVAREYGLPAVANIPGLLQTIHDGEQLTVDGSAGRVQRHRRDRPGVPGG